MEKGGRRRYKSFTLDEERQTKVSNILCLEVSKDGVLTYFMIESHVHEVAMHVCSQESGSNQVG